MEAHAPDPQILRELANVQATLVKIEEEIASLLTEEDRLGKSQAAFYSAFTEAVNRADRARRACEAWEAEKKNLSFNRERIALREEEWRRQVAQTGKAVDLFMHGGKPLEMSERDAEQCMFKLRGDLASMGEVDEAILKEAAETEARYSHLETELRDLEAAARDLETLIRDLNDRIRTEFREALVQINSEFSRLFGLMFEGGSAEMVLTKPPKPKAEKEDGEEEKKIEAPEESEEGVEVELKLPKKRVTSLEVLSGGERSLVGIAALFALISVSPPPFLVLDEVDAPLDERNARRFADLLKTFSKESQFVVVTHNRATMEAAHILYGVTTDSDGVSKVLSITLGEYEDEKARPA
jgi:chromosome segregation protein